MSLPVVADFSTVAYKEVVDTPPTRVEEAGVNAVVVAAVEAKSKKLVAA